MNLLSRLLRREPEIARYSWDQYQSDLSFAFNGQRYLLSGGSSGWTKTEDLEHSFVSYVNNLYKSNGVIFAITLARLLLFAEGRFCWFEINENGDDGKPAGRRGLEVLERPWPNGGTGELMSRMEQDVTLGGNFFAAREPSRIRRLRPDWVTIVLTAPPAEATQSDVAGYWYHPGRSYTSAGNEYGKDDEVYLPDEVCHWSPIPDPDAQYRGMSWLTPVIREVMADKAARDHKLAFFENGATFGAIISAKESLTNQQYKEWKANFEGIHSGAANAYKSLFLASPVDTSVLSANMQQLDFKVVQGAGETRLCAAGGVPPIIVGLSEGLASATYSNYGMARRKFGDHWAHPQWKSASQALSALVDPPGDDLRLGVNTKGIAFLREDAKDLATIQQIKASTLSTLIMGGFTPDSSVAAVEAEDLSLLEHTGLTSVQLVPPGTDPLAEEDFTEDEFVDEEFDEEFEFDEDLGRARYDVRNPAGSVGGGRFRKLSDAIVALLKDGADLDDFTQPQLRKAADQLGLVTPRARYSREHLERLLKHHARGDKPPAKKKAAPKPEPADINPAMAEVRRLVQERRQRRLAVGIGDEPTEAETRKVLDRLTVPQLEQLHEDMNIAPLGSRATKPALIRSLWEEATGHARRVFGDDMPGRLELVDRALELHAPDAKPAKKATPRAPAKKAAPEAKARADNETFDARAERGKKGDAALGAVVAGTERDRRGLSDSQHEAFVDYKGIFFNLEVNEGLRGNRELKPETVARIRDMDRAMQASLLTDEIVVYRGIGEGPEVFGAQFDGDLTDVEVTDAAFMSTSTNEDAASGYSRWRNAPRPVVMRLVVPEGVGAVHISDARAETAGRAEILLQRGLKLRVVRDRGEVDGIRRLDVEVVPDAPDAKPDSVILARQRQADIDTARNYAHLASELDELTANEVSDAALLHRLEASVRRGDLPEAEVAPLLAAVRGGGSADRAEAQRLVAALLASRGITQDGNAGEPGRFDPKVHQPIDGSIRQGAPVEVVRPGFTLERDGERIRLSKAVVEEAPTPTATEPEYSPDPFARVFQQESPAGLVERLKKANSESEARITLASTPPWRLLTVAELAGINVGEDDTTDQVRDAVIKKLVSDRLASPDAAAATPDPLSSLRTLDPEAARDALPLGPDTRRRGLPAPDELLDSDIEDGEIIVDRDSLRRVEEAKTVADLRQIAKDRQIRIPSRIRTKKDIRDLLRDELRLRPAEDVRDYFARTGGRPAPERYNADDDAPSGPYRPVGHLHPGDSPTEARAPEGRPSGLPTDRKPVSADFDDLVDRVQFQTEAQVLEILQDLNATELARLARKFSGGRGGGGMGGDQNKPRGLAIPADLTLDERRRWLAAKIAEQRWQWRSEDPDPDDIERADYDDDPGEPDDEQRARAQASFDDMDEDAEEPEDGDYDMYRAAGADTNLGGERLHYWWTKGPGLSRWANSPHPWTALYTQLREHVGAARAKRMASAWFHEVFGIWSGERKGDNPVGPG